MQEHRLVVHRLDVHAEFKTCGTGFLVGCGHDHIGLARRIRSGIHFQRTGIVDFDLKLAILALGAERKGITFRILEPRGYHGLRVLQSPGSREVF